MYIISPKFLYYNYQIYIWLCMCIFNIYFIKYYIKYFIFNTFYYAYLLTDLFAYIISHIYFYPHEVIHPLPSLSYQLKYTNYKQSHIGKKISTFSYQFKNFLNNIKTMVIYNHIDLLPY